MSSRKIYSSSVNPDIRYIESMYLDSEDEFSLYSTENSYIENPNKKYDIESNESEYNYEWSNKTWNQDMNRVFDRNSLYTMSINTGNNYGYEDNYNDFDRDNEDLNPIIDLYAQSYEEYDNSEIEPVMSLPLTPRQYMLMKNRWNNELEMELRKANLKQNKKIVSWSGFSNKSNKSDNSNSSYEDYPSIPSVPRNSNASNLSDNSKKSVKSTRSWKSFLSKFTKKKKKEIKFYDNLLQK